MAGQTIAISVLADTKKLKSGLGEAGGLLGKLGGAVGGVAKIVGGTVAGIGAAIGGLAIGGGIARALNIDDAQTKLRALGYDAKAMSGIMDSALASVRGTSYGLGDAATLASQALAAGIPQGDALTKSLTLVTNTAALAGTGLGDMGSIFAKVWTSGRVGTEELNQLADRGIPVWTTLASSLGVGVDELRKMVSAGEVTAEMFTSSLEPAVSGIAGVMGQSFRGLVSNAMAALSRLGAIFAGPAIEAAKPWLQFFTNSIDSISGMLAPLGERFASFLSGVKPPESLGALFSGLDASGLVDGIASAVTGAAEWLAGGGLASIFTAITNAREGFLTAALAAFPGILDALVAIVPQAVAGIGALVTQLVGFLSANAPALLAGGVALLAGLVGAAAQIIPPTVASLLGLLPSIVTALLEMAPAILESAVTLLNSIVAAIPVILPPLIDTLVALLPELVGAILGMIPGILDGAINLFTALIAAIPVILPKLISGILTLLPRLITTIVSMIPRLLDGAVRLFTGIVQAIPKIIPELVPALIRLGPEMVRAIVSMVPSLLRAGVDLIAGLVRGLWQAGASVGSALLDIAKGAINGFKAFLGIKSPSRLFAGFGGDVVAGLARGLGQSAPVARAMGALSATVAESYTPPGALAVPTVTSDARRAAVDALAVSNAGPDLVELGPGTIHALVQAMRESGDVFLDGRAMAQSAATHFARGSRLGEG